MGKGSTKERVEGAAVLLFNERGTAAVSTNHVAEAAGISPGNLYYHFRNKEEIIRAIFARVDAHWEEAYALPSDRAPTLDDVRGMVGETFSGLWEYRFFYRELGALTRRDPELAGRYRRLRERGVAGTEALLRAFVGAGVMEGPRDEAALSRLARTLMLIAEFWLPFEETGGEASDRELLTREGVSLVMQILEPYLGDGAADRPSGTAARDGGGR